MSTVEKDAQVLVKRSWKLPVVYVAASILLLVFGVSTHGDVTIRLNDKSQSYSIPDIVTSGAPIVWVLVALTILVTACAVIVTVRRIDVPSWARAVGMSVVGVSTILGFLLYAGSDSAGAVTLTSTLVSTVAISTPLIFGALSGVISERVGVVNIAIEGDLLVGAFAGIMAASYFQTAYAGLVAAPLAGALLGALLALLLTRTAVLTLPTFGGLLLATLGTLHTFGARLTLSGSFGRRRSCRGYLRGRLLRGFTIALLTLGALTAVVAVVIASVAVIVIAVVAIATTFASRALGLVVATLLAILLTALATLLAVITILTLATLLTLLTAVIAFVALATLLTGLTTTTLLTLVGLLLLRLSGSCGLGRSFLALLIVAVLLALAAGLLTLEGLVIGALTK